MRGRWALRRVRQLSPFGLDRPRGRGWFPAACWPSRRPLATVALRRIAAHDGAQPAVSLLRERRVRQLSGWAGPQTGCARCGREDPEGLQRRGALTRAWEIGVSGRAGGDRRRRTAPGLLAWRLREQTGLSLEAKSLDLGSILAKITAITLLV